MQASSHIDNRGQLVRQTSRTSAYVLRPLDIHSSIWHVRATVGSATRWSRLRDTNHYIATRMREKRETAASPAAPRQ